MPEELKPILARQMEVFAGFLEHTDHHVGRLVEALEDLEVFDDTLIYYIIGDNGSSAEGTPRGTFNELFMFNGAAHLETPEFLASKIDDFGGPEAFNHFAVGWAHATDTPYQWTKQIASHWGGTRNGTIVHWPRGFAARGEIRSQFHHVIDVAPTILDAAGVPEPAFVNGIEQQALHGTSMRYCFDDAAAAERRPTQYFECMCNRGIYHRGWTAVTRHATPWVPEPLNPLEGDVWELYDTNADWSQAHDLASEMPEKLEELKRLFLFEAVKYGVLPLDDRRVERFNPDLAGRPTLIRGNPPASVRRHGAAHREFAAERQEQDARGHRSVCRARRGRRRRVGGPGRSVWWLVAVPARWQAHLLLQPVRDDALPRRRHGCGARGRPSASDGVRLRRRRVRQGRHGEALPGRGRGRRGPRRWDRPDGLLAR
jgi:arylsulfatase